MTKRFIKYLDQFREGLELKVGEMTVSYSIAPEKVSELPKIVRSKDIYDFILPRWESDINATERFKVIFLNNQLRILGFYTLGVGSSVGTVCDVPKLIGITTNIPSCKSVIILHNHPSGLVRPSDADIKLTQELKEALKLVEVTLSDSLIVCPETYYSFADETNFILN